MAGDQEREVVLRIVLPTAFLVLMGIITACVVVLTLWVIGQ